MCNCTASITTTLLKDGTVSADVCYNHYGHDTQLEHLRLSKENRNEIAAKLKQGVSRQKIIDNIRDNVQDFKRCHLLERKDVHNIQKAFGLNDVQRHANDQQSVLAWIHEWQTSNDMDNPVLYFKLQGDQAEEGYDLEKDDFFIVIQNSVQKRMLQQFGGNGICIDSTHGTNAYDFMLNTVLVIDDFGEGFPVAWCLSNHEDFTTMVIFFNEIKKNSGVIHSNFVMTDMAEQYFNAWVGVMGDPRPAKLLCTWHVDKAWKENLREKIGNIEVENEVYKMLRTVLEQTSVRQFENCLNGLQNRLALGSGTKRFLDYFEKEWAKKPRQWAYCYRAKHNINTNMFVEAFHRVFKRVYLGGKVNKRVDSCLVNLMKFIRDKTFERLIKKTKGKTTYRKKNIEDRHIRSQEMSLELVERVKEGKWFVKSVDGSTYEVSRVNDRCPENMCNMVCSECQICTHVFACNCSDYLVLSTMCKHIHLVQRFIKDIKEEDHRVKKDEVHDYLNDDNGHQNDDANDLNDENHLKDENHMIYEEMNEFEFLKSKIKGPNSDVTSVKSRINEKMLSLMTKMNSSNNLEALKYLEKKMTEATSVFITINQEKKAQILDIKNEKLAPANKNMATQRRFYSTKKKRCKTSNIRYARPSKDEMKSFFSTLNNDHLLSPGIC